MLEVADGAFDTLQLSSVKCCWSRDVPMAKICALLSHVTWIGFALCLAILPIVLVRGKRVPRLLHFVPIFLLLMVLFIPCYSLDLCWVGPLTLKVEGRQNVDSR